MDIFNNLLANLANEKITPIDKSIIENLPFDITSEPIKDAQTKKVPEHLMQESYDLAHKGGNNSIRRIKKLIEKYPNVTSVYNHLHVAYLYSGKMAKAKEVQLLINEKFPDYLFGKISFAEQALNNKEYDRIPEILGKRLKLEELYP